MQQQQQQQLGEEKVMEGVYITRPTSIRGAPMNNIVTQLHNNPVLMELEIKRLTTASICSLIRTLNSFQKALLHYLLVL